MRTAPAVCLDSLRSLPSVPLGHHLGARPSTLRIERRTVTLEFRSTGRLVPWLGPAVRGITALRHRAGVCRQPREEWTDRWRHCRGCPHLRSCGYGIAFEPDGPQGSDAIRRLVIAPEFPVAVSARRGTSIRVRITSIGTDVSAVVPEIITALAAAGQRDGLGPDRVRFAIADMTAAPEVLVVDPQRLPAPTDSPILPRLTIRLDGPLFLREREARSRHMILAPDFPAFVRHARRIVHECFPGLGEKRGDDHESHAAAVAISQSSLRSFHQEKASRRTFRRFDVQGVVGDCTFANVPGFFLPWLTLAGILHVGGHRVAGAGGWTVLTASDAAAAGGPAGSDP